MRARYVKESSVGIGAMGRGGYGAGNGMTPASQHKFAQAREAEERDEALEEELDEELNEFEKTENLHKSLSVGPIYGKVNEFITFLEEEMDWNHPTITFDNGTFEYIGMAGSPIDNELEEAIELFGWKDVVTIEAEKENNYNDPSGPSSWDEDEYTPEEIRDYMSQDFDDEHYYYIKFKKVSESNINPYDKIGIMLADEFGVDLAFEANADGQTMKQKDVAKVKTNKKRKYHYK